MEELFNHIGITPNWDILFGFFSILGAIISWLIKVTSDVNKDIQVKYISIEKLIDKPNELSNNLKISLNGIEIEQLSKMEVILENSGSNTLNKSDFHMFPKINLSGFTNIINLNVLGSNKFTTCEIRKIDFTQTEFLVENFESKNYIMLELFFESILDEYQPKFEFQLKEDKEFTIDLKELQIDKHFGISNDYNALYLIISCAGIATFFLTLIFVCFGLTIDVKNSENFSIGWKIVFWAPTVLVCIYSILRWNKIIVRHHWGYQKIKSWHSITPKIVSIN